MKAKSPNSKNTTTRVREYYDARVDEWQRQYDKKRLEDAKLEYPANQFRLDLLLESFKKNSIKRVFEVGFGEGTPLIELSKIGMDVRGFDLSPNMVERGKKKFQAAGLDPERVFIGDIQDKKSYSPFLEKVKKFDGLIAMGVMPHVVDEKLVLQNMMEMVRPGGRVFIEFRNSLFSLFTQNRYTADFIVNDLLKDVSPRMKSKVARDLAMRLRLDQPLVRKVIPGTKKNGYDRILSKFHNPFEIEKLFQEIGFKDPKFLWYHYHAAMPYLQNDNRKLFLEESKKLENENSGWRGYFLCSAFVIEAQRP